MDKRECNAERKGKRDRTVCCRSHDSKPGREVRWEDGETTEDGEWELEDSSRPPSPFDHGEGHNDLFGPRLVPLDGARTERKVRKRSHSSSTGSSSKEPTSPSVSPVADGSGGGQDAGSSGNETAPPSVSPVADGSGGGKEAAASADDLEPAIILTRRCPPAEAYECGIHGNQWHPFSCEECKLVLELIRGPV